MAHFLSQNKLAYLWGKLTSYFVAKVGDATITGNVTATGNISSSGNISCTGSLTSNSNVINGNMSVTGNITIGGEVVKNLQSLTLGSDFKYNLDEAASGSTYLLNYYDIYHFKSNDGDMVLLDSRYTSYATAGNYICNVWKKELSGTSCVFVTLEGVISIPE